VRKEGRAISDYNLVSTGGATWLTPDELTAALADAFPDSEIKHDLVPGAPVTVWAYVPDGEHRTAEITLDETGRMLTFTDASPISPHASPSCSPAVIPYRTAPFNCGSGRPTRSRSPTTPT
jgi:hypothetical protein